MPYYHGGPLGRGNTQLQGPAFGILSLPISVEGRLQRNHGTARTYSAARASSAWQHAAATPTVYVVHCRQSEPQLGFARPPLCTLAHIFPLSGTSLQLVRLSALQSNPYPDVSTPAFALFNTAVIQLKPFSAGPLAVEGWLAREQQTHGQQMIAKSQRSLTGVCGPAGASRCWGMHALLTSLALRGYKLAAVIGLPLYVYPMVGTAVASLQGYCWDAREQVKCGPLQRLAVAYAQLMAGLQGIAAGAASGDLS